MYEGGLWLLVWGCLDVTTGVLQEMFRGGYFGIFFSKNPRELKKMSIEDTFLHAFRQQNI